MIKSSILIILCLLAMNSRAYVLWIGKIVIWMFVEQYLIPWYEYDRGIICVVWYVMFNHKIGGQIRFK